LRWPSRSSLSFLTAGTAILSLALWVRNPVIPYADDGERASAFSADTLAERDGARTRAIAIGSLRRAVAEAEATLHRAALRALEAPSRPDAAFDYLRAAAGESETGVILFEKGAPLAWAGKFRTDPRQAAAGTGIVFAPFYTALHIALSRGNRRAVATALVHAEPPASRFASAIDSRIGERDQVTSFAFSAASDTAAGEVVRDRRGLPLFRVDAAPLSREMVRFNRTAANQARATLLLGTALILFIAISWTDRRLIARRLYGLAVAAGAVALVPWNNFSNLARAFDPAYYYLPRGGAVTANAGALLLFTILLVLAVFALVRARRFTAGRAVASAAAVALFIGGAFVALQATSGISLPPSGSTDTLWLSWHIPVFMLLFAFWLASAWMATLATGRINTVHLRAAALVAMAAGATAVIFVGRTETRQRLELATRDIARLQQPDGDAANLLRRFAGELAAYDSAGARADVLKRYAVSDLAPADLQVSLATWTQAGAQTSSLDIAPLAFDESTAAGVVREALASGNAVIRQTLGPAGRQVIVAAPHRAGGATSVVVSPRTRLVASDPFGALLGFAAADQHDAPYSLTISDATQLTGQTFRRITWRRIGDEWHGDDLIETSRGFVRAHAEVDIRSLPMRIVGGSLIVILDVAIVGLLWALGAMAEGGFLRWVRSRGWKWVRSYRGRLTLALFTFFVVPAIAFAAWSYQRLRSDDREVRELLVRETLNAAAASADTPVFTEGHGGTPLFLHSNGLLESSSDSLYTLLAPVGRTLPGPVHQSVVLRGELTASWQQSIGQSKVLWGYRSIASPQSERLVLSAPAPSGEHVLDRRRRDLTMLVLFATAAGGLAALWLSGIAAKRLARDLELSRVEVARAERVLAWGEMARQVAHEIKNPLTPIRLGVQHLRRARNDPRVDFDSVLRENVSRILSEIDRLDEIARAFSRYGSAPSELPLAEEIDVAAILRDVVGLERIGVGDLAWSLDGAARPAFAQARAEELREVLLNVFENARLARARNVSIALERGDRSVCIRISDDGSGISRAALPRVFEPHFSTRTTGSGLGLAISRRLLESWGGTIDIISEEGSGARVLITLRAAAA